MNKFLGSLLTVERTIQLVALVGVIVFLRYLGAPSFHVSEHPLFQAFYQQGCNNLGRHWHNNAQVSECGWYHSRSLAAPSSKG
jgi:hypothetical protein